MNKIFDPQSKIIANLDRVLATLEGKVTPPVLVEIDPSNTCNHACKFCISSYIHLPESKHLETYDKSIMSRCMLIDLCKDLKDLGVGAINWTGGGEPTINPYLSEAIQVIGKNIPMGMFTNGCLLHKNDLIKTVVDNLKWIRISVDAGTRVTYDTVRRVKNDQGWDRMMINLKDLLTEKKEKNSPIDVGVGFVITPDSYSEIVDFALEFVQVDGLSYCQYKPEIVNKERSSGIQREVSFWKEKVEPKLDEAKKILGNKYQINGYKLDDLATDPSLYGRTYKKCLGSQIQPCVGADGYVYVCTNQRGYKQYSYGNLKDKSFSEIWSDLEKRNKIMELINDVEKFSNCTQLCKPHESNKKMWEIYERLNDRNYIEQLKIQKTQLNIKHPEFV